MRISDWSSDVCSSDLAHGIGRFRKQSGRHVITGRGSFKLLAALKKIPAFFFADLDVFQNLVELGLVDDRPYRCVGSQRRPNLNGLHTLLQRLHKPVRSDEHTSELQSLMRLSYAVFCLKT